jgi:hypothetical protein
MKSPIPTCVIRSALHTIAGYEASAFLCRSCDVGGRARPKKGSQDRKRSLVTPVIIGALAFAIAILAVAAANADTIPLTTHAVIVRYWDEVRFGAAGVDQSEKMTDAAMNRLISKTRRIYGGLERHAAGNGFDPTALSAVSSQLRDVDRNLGSNICRNNQGGSLDISSSWKGVICKKPRR